ncbi:lysoplasmalogenase family protein [Kribbella pittospori]|nr:lysoplasmalogenase family protein [Kribbella pittospori]
MRKGSGWLVAYWVLSVAHLITIAIDETWSMVLTKVALMPTLAMWVRTQGGPVGLLVALAASLAGDFLLQIDQLLPGMVAFGVAHVCYIVLFTRRTTHRSPVVLVAYIVFWAGALALLWPGLSDDRIPVAAYSLLVTATAITPLSRHGDVLRRAVPAVQQPGAAA